MSDFYSGRDDKESTATIHYALDHGCTFLDTADMYGYGENEILIGAAIKDRRSKVFLATKFGVVRDKNNPAVRAISGKPDYVKKSCEASLKRLGTDHIDVSTPIEETVHAMGELVKEGKVRHIGLSEVDSDVLRKANKIHQLTALQSEYSLWSREPEDKVLSTCRELGIGFVPYSPLGRGFLTGQIKSLNDFAEDDYRKHSPRFQGDNFRKNLELVAQISQIAKEKHATPAQLALAWVLSQGGDIVPIPGTKKRKYLEENLKALEISLSAEDLQRIDRVSPHGVAAGSRYADGNMPPKYSK